MDSIDYGKALAKEFSVSEEDAIKAVRAEADAIRDDPFRLPRTRKPSYAHATEAAYNHVREWLATGHTYAVKLEWESLTQFTMSHRKACVWAVLTAKAREGCQ